MRKAFFTLVLLSTLAGTAESAPPSRDAREQEALEDGCERSQMNMNICSFYDYKLLDAELNTNYTKQLERLKGSPAAKRLIAAQRAWLRYAESDCLYQAGPREESGSIWPFQHNTCMSAHLKQRIAVIKEFLECTQGGCPSAQ